MNSTRFEARQKLDEQIRRLEAKLLRLKRTRNSLSPIGSLHPELLQEIFLLSSSNGIQGKGSLLVSWVCSGWREIALKFTALWSSIDFTNFLQMRTFLSRTRNRPLEFRLHLALVNKVLRVAQLCLESLPRIKTLEISCDRGKFPRFSPLWISPAPFLVSLALWSISLPPNVFSGNCPALQVLTLVGCEIDWDQLPVHSGITHLCIIHPVSKTTTSTILSKLDVIGSKLKELTLTNTLLPISSSSTSPLSLTETRRYFENLTQFTLTEVHPQAMVPILDGIALPPRLKISVEFQYDASHLNVIRSLVASRRLDQWPVKHLDISIDGDHFEITMDERLEDHNVCETCTLFQFNSSTLSDVVAVFHVIPLIPLQSLDLWGGSSLNHGSSALDYFSQYGMVQYLAIEVFHMQTFTSYIHRQNNMLRTLLGLSAKEGIAITDIDDELRDQCRNVIAFHQLRSLRYHGEPDDESWDRQFYTILQEWLVFRAYFGLKIEEFIIVGVNIPPQDYLNSLFEGVVKVSFAWVEEIKDESKAIPFDEA